MVWAVARAHTQAITIDEAVSYLVFVRSAQPLHWTPAANNHLLNSLLMRLSTLIFGVTHAVLEKNMLDTLGLKAIYHGKSTDVVIAVRPEMETALHSSVCFLRPLP
jgi:hypothetical protein